MTKSEQRKNDNTSQPSIAKSNKKKMLENTNKDHPHLILDISHPEFYSNRDINWLDFNHKILVEALDAKNPLLEQLKFLSIFQNNLDEFFMVRVANVFLQYTNGVDSVGPDKISPAKQLAVIRKTTLEHIHAAYSHWTNKLHPELKAKNIQIKKFQSLSKSQKKYVEDFYNNEIYPVLTPQAIDPTHPMPNISNLSINFILKLRDESNNTYYARLKCPNNLPRFIIVPQHRNYGESDYSTNSPRSYDIILLEEIIKVFIQGLFTGYEIEHIGLFRITRNTDIKIEEDEAHDLLRTVQHMVEQRRFGNVIRLEVNNSIPIELRDFLMEKLGIKPFQVYKIKGIIAFSELIGLSGIDKPALKYPPYTPYIPKNFRDENLENLFESIKQKDVFLHLPYDSFLPIQEFIHQASIDPNVIAIKQTLYRTGKNSPIIKSLMEAKRLGKQVTAVVELKARFDEEQNITWAEELEKSGVHVVYGIPGMKIHAKLCLVVRKEPDRVRRYVHIGTGNYNPVTAKIYTDMGILTAEEDICADVSDLFNVMTGYAKKENYKQLLVSPSTLRKRIFQLIDEEIDFHYKHANGEIHIKCNQLTDTGIIQKLYRASQAGVKVHLQVRGVCCLRPQIKGVSDNITVTTIVGRFLEHPRVLSFNHNGQRKVFIGSADLMTRNLDRRIEVITPITNPRIAYEVHHTLLEYFREDTNAYYLQKDGSYIRKIDKEGVDIQSVMLSKIGTRKYKKNL